MRSSHIVDVARAIELAERPQGVMADELARLSTLQSPNFPSAVRRARFILRSLEEVGFLVGTSEADVSETPIRGRPRLIYNRPLRRPLPGS